MTGWAVVDALGVAIAVVLLAWTSLLYAPFWWRPVGLHLFVPKQAAGAFTPFIAAAGLLLALVGGLRGSRWMAVPAGLAAVAASIVVVRLGLLRADLAAALGPNWADRIPVERRARMVGHWWRRGWRPRPSHACARTSPSRRYRAPATSCCATCGSPQPACLLRGWP
jgi:hypothetical protein